jgi:hypothetical protein
LRTSGAPAAREEDHVVVREIHVVDAERLAHFPLELGIVLEPPVRCRLDQPQERQRIDRDLAALDAGDVNLHAAVFERVVGRGHLRGEHPGRLVARRQSGLAGRDDQRPAAGPRMHRAGVVPVQSQVAEQRRQPEPRKGDECGRDYGHDPEFAHDAFSWLPQITRKRAPISTQAEGERPYARRRFQRTIRSKASGAVGGHKEAKQ